MSHPEATDLLCRSRREELNADEQRRLDEAMQHSLEVKLMSHLLSEFEKESRVRPGDDLLLARINARALGGPAPKERRFRKHRLSVLLLAAAFLLVASMAGAWFSGVNPSSVTRNWARVFESAPRKTPKPARPRVQPIAKPTPSQTVKSDMDPMDGSELPQIAPDGAPAPAPSSSVQRRPTREPKAVASANANTPSDLFARANFLRRQGRAAEAASFYQLLLDLYPNSREVPPARLALAKYLQAKQPARALAHYRAVAASGDALRAEALWGVTEAATALGERSLAAQALSDLMREFPDSPYAEVARARTSHGKP